MADLSTTYLGLKLKNPLIVASSRLTSSLDSLVEFENSGVGAVVLKSLFEEQIEADTSRMIEGLDPNMHTDALDFFIGTGKNFYLNDYLLLVKEAKKRLTIPVIASINCISADTWIDYAGKFEDVGADALELNVFIMPVDIHQDPRELEKRYLDIYRKVQSKTSLPISLKLGYHFTGMANMFNTLSKEGVKGLVLFNRFYRPDVDVENLKIIPASVFSVPEELTLSLQWIAILSGELSCDLCAATGIHTGEGLIKQLLVGATVAQVCTAFFKKGRNFGTTMLADLESWMNRKGYKTIEDFRGLLSREKVEDPTIYERSQYVKALVGIS